MRHCNICYDNTLYLVQRVPTRGGVLTPSFGRYVPRKSEKWARAPEQAPGRAGKCESPERPRARGAAERFVFRLSRSWEAMKGLKLKKF